MPIPAMEHAGESLDKMGQGQPITPFGNSIYEADGVRASLDTDCPDSLDIATRKFESRILRARLGLANGLFLALRAKHAQTAAHSLRVALCCSKWSERRGDSEHVRSILEVAALLHDIGKIGIPDQVLHKKGTFVGEELAIMDLQYQLGSEILRGTGASFELLEIIETYRQWYSSENASKTELPPVSARMLAIADAYDAMISEQVFRKAMASDVAISELFALAGSQFDPELVSEFSRLIAEKSAPENDARTAERWLSKLGTDLTSGFWEENESQPRFSAHQLVDALYHGRLLESTSDAVIYVDHNARIIHWNRAAERMTGHSATMMLHQVWTTDLMGMFHENATPITPEDCPLKDVFTSRVQAIRRQQLKHRDGRTLYVNMHLLPVVTTERDMCGAIFLIRDASAQANLEQKVQTLYERATRDPLTGTANRAELNRQLPEFVNLHLEGGLCGSMIICDIDHFKRINDTYGHQAGDDALVVFGSLLREMARESDLVARYGGEEFVVLCSGCDLAAAIARAEEIRRAVERRNIPSLRGNCVTASFGVTQVHLGDTDESFLARADRALLLAKESGRNRVIQLSAVAKEKATVTNNLSAGWFGWFGRQNELPLLEKNYVTPVPSEIAVQKLGGFVNDHKGEVLKVEPNHLVLRVDSRNVPGIQRGANRPAVLTIDVRLEQANTFGPGRRDQVCATNIYVSTYSPKARDRRVQAVIDEANMVLRSFQSYLMARETDSALNDVASSGL